MKQPAFRFTKYSAYKILIEECVIMLDVMARSQWFCCGCSVLLSEIFVTFVKN